jgi:hypothetical protein
MAPPILPITMSYVNDKDQQYKQAATLDATPQAKGSVIAASDTVKENSKNVNNRNMIPRSHSRSKSMFMVGTTAPTGTTAPIANNEMNNDSYRNNNSSHSKENNNNNNKKTMKSAGKKVLDVASRPWIKVKRRFGGGRGGYGSTESHTPVQGHHHQRGNNAAASGNDVTSFVARRMSPVTKMLSRRSLITAKD